MKTKLLILSFLINVASVAQNDKIKSFAAATFFGYNCTVKPEKIESETKRPVDYGEVYDEKNRVSFNSHPLTNAKVKGWYNVTYLYFERLYRDYGVYKMEMWLEFENYKAAKELLEKLKRMCRENAESKDEVILRGSDPTSEKCTYDYDAKLQLPRIVLAYTRVPHRIRISVYTTYDFARYRKYNGRMW